MLFVVVPVSNEAGVIGLDSRSVTINFIFAVVSDVLALVGEYEFSEAVHVTCLHLSRVGLPVTFSVDSEVFPVIVEPEAFVLGDIVATLVDSVACGLAIFPFSVIDIAVNVNYAASSILTVDLPHTIVSGSLRLYLLTVTMLDFSLFLDLAVVDSAILVTD